MAVILKYKSILFIGLILTIFFSKVNLVAAKSASLLFLPFSLLIFYSISVATHVS